VLACLRTCAPAQAVLRSMKKLILLLPLLSGCAYLRSTTTSITGTNGITTAKTTVRAYSLFDANAQLTRFRNSTGSPSTNGIAPGTYVGSLNESSSASNLVNAITVGIGAGLKAAGLP
jgi:hypothetical protein